MFESPRGIAVAIVSPTRPKRKEVVQKVILAVEMGQQDGRREVDVRLSVRTIAIYSIQYLNVGHTVSVIPFYSRHDPVP